MCKKKIIKELSINDDGNCKDTAASKTKNLKSKCFTAGDDAAVKKNPTSIGQLHRNVYHQLPYL